MIKYNFKEVFLKAPSKTLCVLNFDHRCCIVAEKGQAMLNEHSAKNELTCKNIKPYFDKLVNSIPKLQDQRLYIRGTMAFVKYMIINLNTVKQLKKSSKHQGGIYLIDVYN